MLDCYTFERCESKFKHNLAFILKKTSHIHIFHLFIVFSRNMLPGTLLNTGDKAMKRKAKIPASMQLIFGRVRKTINTTFKYTQYVRWHLNREKTLNRDRK